MQDAVDDRVEPELRRQLEPAANVALAAPEVRRVDGDDQRLVAGGRRPFDHVAQQRPVFPDVDLEPAAAVSVGGGHLFDRTGRQRRQRVRQASPLCRPGDGQLALGIGDTCEPGRCQHEGEGDLLAQQRRGRVDGRDVAKHPRAKPVVGERVAVGTHRPLVLGTAVDVVEHPGRKATLGDPPQVVGVRCRGQPALVGVELEASESEDGAQRVEHGAEMLRRAERGA